MRTLLAGEVVGGKYILQRRLASGGMGEIWVATNRATQALVAVKAVRADGVDIPQIMERTRQEALVGAKLQHRHLVRVFDLAEEADGTLFVVMELLSGEPLASYLHRQGPISNRQGVLVAVSVLSALSYLHGAGVLHRDITPSNIFLSVEPDGTVVPKLIDLGIARVQSGPIQTAAGDVLGTPHYLSPERIRGSSNVDGRSDIFAMAIVLYESIVGENPFQLATPAASLAAILEVEVDASPRIDPKLWFVLKRALSKRPYERPADAAQFMKELLEAIGEAEPATTIALTDVHSRMESGPSEAMVPVPGGTPSPDPFALSRGGLPSVGSQVVPGNGETSIVIPGVAVKVPVAAWVALGLAVLGGVVGLSVLRSSSRPAGAASPVEVASDAGVLAAPAISKSRPPEPMGDDGGSARGVVVDAPTASPERPLDGGAGVRVIKDTAPSSTGPSVTPRPAPTSRPEPRPPAGGKEKHPRGGADIATDIFR